MPKKNKVSNADINTFREAVKGVKRMIPNKVRLAAKSTTIIRKPRPQEVDKEPPLYFSENERYAPCRSDEIISFKQAGVPDKTLRKLSKGQYNVEARLDLHGMSIEQAKQALSDFMQQCVLHHWRVVIIIHGKGLHSEKPVLKNRINHWLRDMPYVLAFCSAIAKHGGRGAVYVLLKSLNDSRSI